MGISIKQLILNTKIKKGGSDSGNSKPAEASDSSLLSKREKEEIIEECMQRVAAYIEYELKP